MIDFHFTAQSNLNSYAYIDYFVFLNYGNEGSLG